MNSTIDIPDSLLNYVRTETGRGVAVEALREQLIASQWQAETVEAAFLEVGKQADPLALGQTGTTVSTTEITTHSAGGSRRTVTRIMTSETVLGNIFRGGFAFIFIINGVVAWVRPTDFIKLLNTFPLAVGIGHIPQMVMFTGLHDLTLGIFILSGKWRKYVWAWAGIWLSLVTIIKLVSLL